MSFESLVAEHDDIERLLDALRGAVDAAVPDVADAVAIMRNLGAALASHDANEARIVYTHLIDAPDREASREAAEFNHRYEQLREDVTTYFYEWTQDCIALDWAAFVDATRTIARRLQERVRHETATIYMLALRKGTIRLRAA